MTCQNKISSKTIARIAAVQLMYQYQLEVPAPNINLLMQQMIQFYQDERARNNSNNSIKVKFSISYFEALVKCVVLKLAQIDNIIIKYLASEWAITNLPILLVALLRVAVCELLYFPHVPRKVIINEFTDIGSDMVNDHEVAFINSILDNIATSSEQYES
ncbi:transcription antitermination factor NusB [Candidatus Tisiphia endosymbiont of Nemotelus uliginosus]|uniref:transcription antitermination factor NusB n=1 Tax=Candidatus Tisiphia endosymbiont of Nemotelus uliginosus TaxID=3077926 RepID=UPI0035C887D3